jgi:hypothetical protein
VPFALVALALLLVTNVLLGPLALGVIRWRVSAIGLNQTYGADAAALVLVVPTALASAWLWHRSARLAPPLALAVGLATVYYALASALGPDYIRYEGNNERFFLVLLALTILSWSVAASAWQALDVRPPIPPSWLSRSVGSILILGAMAIGLAWTRQLLDLAISGSLTGGDALAYADAPTAFWLVRVVDLGFIVPVCLATGVGLWRGNPTAVKAAYGSTQRQASWWLLRVRWWCTHRDRLVHDLLPASSHKRVGIERLDVSTHEQIERALNCCLFEPTVTVSRWDHDESREREAHREKFAHDSRSPLKHCSKYPRGATPPSWHSAGLPLRMCLVSRAAAGRPVPPPLPPRSSPAGSSTPSRAFGFGSSAPPVRKLRIDLVHSSGVVVSVRPNTTTERPCALFVHLPISDLSRKTCKTCVPALRPITAVVKSSGWRAAPTCRPALSDPRPSLTAARRRRITRLCQVSSCSTFDQAAAESTPSWSWPRRRRHAAIQERADHGQDAARGVPVDRALRRSDARRLNRECTASQPPRAARPDSIH